MSFPYQKHRPTDFVHWLWRTDYSASCGLSDSFLETHSIDSCVPLWSTENRRAVLLGLADPPAEFEPPDVEQFLTGWEQL